MNYSIKILATLVSCCLVLSITPAFAQDKPNVDSSVIPSSAALGGVIFPKAIAANPTFRALPREVFTAMGKSNFGFDPMRVKQATFVMAPPQIKEQKLPWGVVLQFSELQGLSDDFIKNTVSKKVAGRTVYQIGGAGSNFGIAMDGDARMVAGTTDYVRKLLTETDGDLATIAREANLSGESVIYCNMVALRPFFDEILQEIPELPGPVNDLKELPALLRSFSMSLNVNDQARIKLDIQMTAENSDSAERVRDILSNAQQVLRDSFMANISAEMDLTDPVQKATMDYANRVWDTLGPKFIPSVSGRKLKIKLNEEAYALPFLAGFIGFQSQEVVTQIEMQSPTNKLRQTGLSMHNYESAFGKFPPHTIRDDDGKPLLSGRVKMLPFLEQRVLYESFDMTQPWNRGHNRELSETIVPSFMNEDGEMVRFPVFPGSMWDNNGELTFGDMSDGVSNTIMAVFANTDQSWADPTPWKISESNPMRDIFGRNEEVTVLMADGSTKQLNRRNMTNEKLKAMLTYAGGEVIAD